jgi:uncharacterized protein YndB with AHSA1/START domain
MSDYDWSRFTLKININAPVEAIYMAWTIPEMLERWFLSKAIFHKGGNHCAPDKMIQQGNTYEWYWHGHEDSVVEKGEVIEIDGIRKLVFSFAGGALVTIDIGEVAGEKILMLTQEKIPDNEHGKVNYHMGCKTGWTFYMANLKSYLEGGIDLRNKNTALANMVNA